MIAKRNVFLGVALVSTWLLGSPLVAEATPPPYYLTLSEAYGRPFASAGFSGRQAYGLGSSLSFEYRAWDYLSVGAVYDHLSIIQHPTFFLNVDNLDLMARVLPFRGPIEPYALLSAGTDISSSGNPIRDAGYHARFGLGVLFSLTDELAADLGGSYQANGPVEQNLSYIDIHVGLQWRIGRVAPAPIPTPASVAVITPVPTATPELKSISQWPKKHTVLKDEDLFGIARLTSVYGDGFLWPLLYDANKENISDARRIEPGMILTVPEPGDEKEKETIRARARINWNKAKP